MNNLKLNNFKIIYNKILNDDNNIKDNLLNINKIPNLYFEGDNRTWYNDDKLIDNYYKIKIKLEKIKRIKDNLLFIVELNKNKFENIFIDKYKYRLDKKFLIYEKDNLEIKNISQFENFINEFLKKRNLVKGLTTNYPHFYEIFNSNYNETDKKYFLKLFKTYLQVRDDLLNNQLIRNNHGLMAYNHFFDISEFLELKKKQKDYLESIVENKRNRNTKNSINYNKYQYYYENIQNNNNNKEDINKKKEEKVDNFKNYDSIYSTELNDNSYKSLNKTNISTILQKINQSINEYLSVGSNGNLYSILINAIQTDYYVIKLLYYYEDPLIYNVRIDLSKKRREFISKLINDFYEYETSYLYWIKSYIRDKGRSHNNLFRNNNNIKHLENFNDFLKKEIQI